MQSVKGNKLGQAMTLTDRDLDQKQEVVYYNEGVICFGLISKTSPGSSAAKNKWSATKIKNGFSFHKAAN